MKRLLLATVILLIEQASAGPVGDRPIGPADGQLVITVDTRQQRPVGIEGNGQPTLGIEGNGVIQRLDQAGPVVNESLYAYGALTVQVVIDGQAADIGGLLPGQVALVSARERGAGVNAGLAVVHVDSLIRGPVDAGGVDPSAGTLSVLGQELSVPGFAELGDALGDLALEDLNAGDYVSIGGFLDDAGAVLATRIQRSPGSAAFEVSGRPGDVDPVQRTMQIGTLPIDYSAALFVGLAAEELESGPPVEVVGTVFAGSGALLAQRIRRLISPLAARYGQRAEMQGLDNPTPVNDRFDLSGATVQLVATTRYDRGTVNDVVPGRILEVEGAFDASGILVATQVEFDEEPLESEIRLEAIVSGVDPGALEFEVLGLTAAVDVATRFEDKTGSGTPFETIADMAPGQFVQVRAYDEPNGTYRLAATRVTREMPDETLLRGRVESNSGDELVVLGRTILTTPDTQYSDQSDMDISASEFFAAAQPGVLVKARGTATANGMEARKLDLE